MAAKKNTKKDAKDLGEVPGVRGERKTGKGGGDSFMHKQRDQDDEDERLGEAASEIKSCHHYVKEADRRLAAARTSTSTTAAIEHDLERVSEVADSIRKSAKKALSMIRIGA